VISQVKADSTLERERLHVVTATIAINVVAVSLLTFAPWLDWRTGAALTLSIIVFSLALRQAKFARSPVLLESTERLKQTVTLTNKNIHEFRLAGDLLEGQTGRF
jgi:hypothetical protein